MKRDLDLYRSLLEYFESLKAGTPTIELSSDNFSCTPTELVEHLELLIEQGLVRGVAQTRAHFTTGGSFQIDRLTAAGHDFLAVSRNDEIWSVTKNRMKQVGSWTFSLIVEVLKEEAKKRFGNITSGGQ